MKNGLTLLSLLIIIILTQCVSGNIEEKYTSTEQVPQPINEIAWFPLNQNLNDSTGNQTMISVSGPITYVNGINKELKTGLYLNGTSNYIIISPGYRDTISILFWLKTAKGVISPNAPVLTDYGFNSISASFDAITEATNLIIKQGESTENSADLGEENFLNTDNKYSLFYLEAGGNTAAFSFQGYLVDGKKHKISNQYVFSETLNPLTDLIYIGRSSNPSTSVNSFFKGCIDEIHIFSRFLTLDELNYYQNIQPN